jgi:hypothetical protein
LFLRALIVVSSFLFFSNIALANWNVGPKECAECHDREYDVWKESPHFKAYKKAHKTKKAKKIVKALGGKSMKKTDQCAICHYTKIQKNESAKAKVKAGPTCESCHGAGSEWIEVHNDFGKGIKKAEDEAPARRVKRLADAEAGGMIASRMLFDISSSCMNCHGLGNKALKAETLKVMLENKHPLEKDFEVVKYSQGKIRHRFVPPNVNDNSKLDSAGIARLYISGQMAALVASNAVKTKVENAKFQAAQKYRIDNSIKNLKTIEAALPALKTFLAGPSADTARAVVEAMKDKDLSKTVAPLLPKESDLK